MPRELTFIHAADLHLGAPFRGLGNLSPTWGARLARAIPEALGRVVDAAIGNGVDFVVVAGDIFDNARPSYADYRCFVGALERLRGEGIAVYLVPGNHDPYVTWRSDYAKLPDNAVWLSDEGPGYALYRKDGEPMCVLAGRGYYNQSFPVGECVAERVTRADAVAALGGDAVDAPFSVGVLHTGLDVDTTPSKAPLDPAVLLASDIDYWALGHIHARRSIPREHPRVCFSGIIQGRDVKETGPRGVNLVTLREGRPNEVRFVPCASVVWQQLAVDVEGLETLADVEEAVVDAMYKANSQSLCEEMCVRVTLTGTAALHDALARPGVLSELREAVNGACGQFFCDAIADATKRPRSYDVLRAADLFPAALLDASEEVAEDGAGLKAYLQEEFAARGLALPLSVLAGLDATVESARDEVLDLLEEGGAR